jgi:gephyrin
MAESCMTCAGAPSDSRRSKYPMISVEEAIIHVLQNSSPLPFENVSMTEACGRIVGEDIKANDPFPSFRASMMDGYAVLGDLEPGVYPVQRRIHAGDATIKDGMLLPGNVVYITTGAMVPEGADAVVKIEDTSVIEGEALGADEKELRVEIVTRAAKGAHIRQIGCDISAGHLTNLHLVFFNDVAILLENVKHLDTRMPNLESQLHYSLFIIHIPYSLSLLS